MARITVEDCLTKETNRFGLVLLAAKRTKQILNGARILLSTVKNKPVVCSLREIADGKVRFMTEEDKVKVKERERERREAALAQVGSQFAGSHEFSGARDSGGSRSESPDENGQRYQNADDLFKSSADEDE